jgi:hypothetical protein
MALKTRKAGAGVDAAPIRARGGGLETVYASRQAFFSLCSCWSRVQRFMLDSEMLASLPLSEPWCLANKGEEIFRGHFATEEGC